MGMLHITQALEPDWAAARVRFTRGSRAAPHRVGVGHRVYRHDEVSAACVSTRHAHCMPACKTFPIAAHSEPSVGTVCTGHAHQNLGSAATGTYRGALLSSSLRQQKTARVGSLHNVSPGVALLLARPIPPY